MSDDQELEFDAPLEEEVDDIPTKTRTVYLRRLSNEERILAKDISHPKTRFISACHALAYRMLVAKDGPKAGDFVFPNDDPLP